MQKLEMSYQSFNVTRDLVKMDFGEEMGENLQGIQLVDWNERTVEIQITFADPLNVPDGEYVVFELQDTDLFISAASGETLPKE